jgi:hypothetical protein
MRAILIDPEQRTITEIQLADDDYRRIQSVLRCHSFTTGAHLGGSLSTGFEAVYVSDDELPDEPTAENPGPRFWFQVDADRNPPSSHPIGGLGLAMGVDTEGAGCDAKISVEELTRRITFTQRKFRGFKMFTGEEALSRGAHFVVEMDAPIIDGADERERDDPEATR